MNGQWKNRTFIKLFVIVLTCILLVEGILLSSFLIHEQRSTKQNTKQAIRDAVENTICYLDDVFRSEYLIAKALRTTPWVVKLSSDTTVFDKQFTPSYMQAISNDFLFLMYSSSETLSRSVYFPHRNMVIHRNGYNSAAYYFIQNGVPNMQVNVFIAHLAQIKAPTHVYVDNGDLFFNNRLFLCYPIQNLSKPHAYLCSILSINKLQSHIKQMLPEYFVGFELIDGASGIPVFTFDRGKNRNASCIVQPCTFSSTAWTLVFYVNESLRIINQSSLFTQLLQFVLLGLLSGIIAVLLSTYAYKPISQLLRMIPSSKNQNNNYRNVALALDEMAEQLHTMRLGNTMRRLLTGSFDENENTEIDTPFTNKMYVQVYILSYSGKSSEQRRLIGMLKPIIAEYPNTIYMLTQFMPKSLVLTVGHCEAQYIEQLSVRLIETLRDESITASVGNVSNGLLGISLSYQSALERLLYCSTSDTSSYYFPMDWENELLTALRCGKENVAIEILKALEIENERRLKEQEIENSDILELLSLLINDLKRVALNVNLETKFMVPLTSIGHCQSMQEAFAMLRTVAHNICKSVHNRIETVNKVSNNIVAYINEHFKQPELSVALLQDIFDMSANTINKNIKAVTNQTFLPYLTSLRMEKAKELLRNPNLKISQVAKDIGYENEYSFRRAFNRYTGYRVQDFEALDRKDAVN